MADKPNILVIICDQLVADLTGAYDHPVVQTPNLNRLVEEGIRFDNGYSPCPICSPTRHAMLSGQYVSRTGNYDNASIMPADTPTLNHYLSVEGYDTVGCGKFHFIGPDQLHGFEKRLTTDVFPSDFNFFSERPESGMLEDFTAMHDEPIAIDYVTAGPRQWSLSLDYDEETHFRALEYLRSKRSQYTGSLQKASPPRDERPFCMFVSYSMPHEPFHPTPELWDMYEGLDIPIPEIPNDLEDHEHPMDKMLNTFHGTHRVDLENKDNLYNMHRAYYAQVSYIDRKVGELLEALDELGLRDDTLIMFMSDHGDMLGERRMVQKRTFYEYSSKVPWIISYPKRWQGGIKVQEPVSLIDLMPTLLDFAGVEEEKIVPVDGQSVIPLIEGERDPERVAFSELHAEGVTMTCFMVRQGDYKYIHTTGYEPQLYNMVDDPKEWNNLAGQPQCKVVQDKLHQLLIDHFDPEQIEHEVRASFARRQVVREAMKTTGLPKWDFQPFFDATQQYWRKG